MRKQRKGGPTLTRDQHTMNLAMALMRTEAAVLALNAADAEAPKERRLSQMKQELMTQDIGPSSRWFAYLSMYFAMVDVVVKSWRRGGFVDPRVSASLEDKRILEMLTDFRDDLMHGGPLIGEEVSAFFSNIKDAEDWSLALRQAVEDYVVKHFATPRIS